MQRSTTLTASPSILGIKFDVQSVLDRGPIAMMWWIQVWARCQDGELQMSKGRLAPRDTHQTGVRVARSCRVWSANQSGVRPLIQGGAEDARGEGVPPMLDGRSVRRAWPATSADGQAGKAGRRVAAQGVS